MGGGGGTMNQIYSILFFKLKSIHLFRMHLHDSSKVMCDTFLIFKSHIQKQSKMCYLLMPWVNPQYKKVDLTDHEYVYTSD